MPNNIYNNLSDQELKAGYWYVRHRVLLRQIGIMVLFVMAGGLLLYGVFGLLNFYVVKAPEHQVLEKELAAPKMNYAILAELNRAKGLQVLETKVFKVEQGVYDLYSRVVNPNSQWVVTGMEYYYLMGDQKSEVQTDFILPGQTKNLFLLNHETTEYPGQADIIIENITWKKINDYQAWSNKVLNFSYENIEVDSGSQKESTQVSFDLINRSPYNFWEPSFDLFFMRNDQVVGVSQVVLDEFLSGEKRSEKMVVFRSFPRGVDLMIMPDINILNPDVFKGFDQGSGELK